MPKLRVISEINSTTIFRTLQQFCKFTELHTKSCTSRSRQVKIDHLAPVQLFPMHVPKARYDVNLGHDFKIHEFPDMNIRASVAASRTLMKLIRFKGEY